MPSSLPRGGTARSSTTPRRRVPAYLSRPQVIDGTPRHASVSISLMLLSRHRRDVSISPPAPAALLRDGFAFLPQHTSSNSSLLLDMLDAGLASRLWVPLQDDLKNAVHLCHTLLRASWLGQAPRT